MTVRLSETIVFTYIPISYFFKLKIFSKITFNFAFQCALTIYLINIKFSYALIGARGWDGRGRGRR